jgi:CBS domain-containing protein
MAGETQSMTSSALPLPSGLELAVSEVMTPGVVTVADNTTVDDAVDALAAHWLHALLVVGSHTGTPLGWVTTRGLLGLIDGDPAMPVTEAITERVVGISPDASVRAAIYAISLAGVTRLLVRHSPADAAEGVISDFDLAVKARLLRRDG